MMVRYQRALAAFISGIFCTVAVMSLSIIIKIGTIESTVFTFISAIVLLLFGASLLWYAFSR